MQARFWLISAGPVSIHSQLCSHISALRFKRSKGTQNKNISIDIHLFSEASGEPWWKLGLQADAVLQTICHHLRYPGVSCKALFEDSSVRVHMPSFTTKQSTKFKVFSSFVFAAGSCKWDSFAVCVQSPIFGLACTGSVCKILIRFISFHVHSQLWISLKKIRRRHQLVKASCIPKSLLHSFSASSFDRLALTVFISLLSKIWKSVGLPAWKLLGICLVLAILGRGFRGALLWAILRSCKRHKRA